MTAAHVSMMLHQMWPGESQGRNPSPSLSFLLLHSLSPPSHFPFLISSPSLPPLPPSSSPLYTASSLPFFLSFNPFFSHPLPFSPCTRPTIPTVLKGQTEATSPEECEVIEKVDLIRIGCRCVHLRRLSNMQL